MYYGHFSLTFADVYCILQSGLTRYNLGKKDIVHCSIKRSPLKSYTINFIKIIFIRITRLKKIYLRLRSGLYSKISEVAQTCTLKRAYDVLGSTKKAYKKQSKLYTNYKRILFMPKTRVFIIILNA